MTDYWDDPLSARTAALEKGLAELDARLGAAITDAVRQAREWYRGVAERRDTPPDPRARSVTVQQVAQRLGCKRTHVFKLLREGTLSRGRKVGRATMVTVASVERLEGVRRG